MIELSETEKTKYLANVALMAFCDSSLSPRELAALEDLRTRIGAKKGTLTIAKKTVESGSHTLTRCGDFAVHVINLSDMLMICFVDGEYSEKERSLVFEFAKSIGLTEDQVGLMVKQAQEAASKSDLGITCPKCSTVASGMVKFCANCGTQLSNMIEEPVKTDFEIPKTGHAVEFADSTAANFPRALEIAKKAPKFQTCLRGKRNWFLAEWPEDSFLAATGLADELAGMRNRRYYHNGVEEPWDVVFAFVWCANGRKTAYRPMEYCFGKDDNQLNPWGCKQLRFDWTEWARWFSYGQFKKSGVLKNTYKWVFDKDRIRHELMANLHHFQRCPFIRSNLIEAVLNAIPAEVEISQSSGWKYSRVYEEVPGSLKVTEVDRSSEFEFKSEYYADGVRPHGLAMLRQILTSAFREAGITDISVDELVKKTI